MMRKQWESGFYPPPSVHFHPSQPSVAPCSNYFSPTQGKLLPYRPAALLRHSSDNVATALLFLLLGPSGISMSIKADLVLSPYTPPHFRPYQPSSITAWEWGPPHPNSWRGCGGEERTEVCDMNGSDRLARSIVPMSGR